MTNTNNTNKTNNTNNTINNTAANNSTANNATANNSTANTPETRIIDTEAINTTVEFNLPLQKLLTAFRLIEPSQKKDSGYIDVVLRSNFVSLENHLVNNDIGRTKLFCHFAGNENNINDAPVFTEKAGVNVSFHTWKYKEIKDFLELIDGETETIRLIIESGKGSDKHVTIGTLTTGQRQFKFSCLELEPKVKEDVLSRSDYTIDATKTDILRALRNAKKVKGTENKRMPNINGICLEHDIDEYQIKLVTIDGFRISINKLGLSSFATNNEDNEDSCMLSYSACNGLIKQMTKATVSRPAIVIVNYDDATELHDETESVTFSFIGTINGDDYITGVNSIREKLPFFNYKPFTKEQETKATFIVNKADLKKKLKALKPFVKNNGIVLTHDYIDSDTPALRIETGSNAVKIPARTIYNKCFAFGVNYKYLMEAIDSQPGKIISIDIVNHLEPAIIQNNKGLNKSLVLPIRLDEEKYQMLNRD